MPLSRRALSYLSCSFAVLCCLLAVIIFLRTPYQKVLGTSIAHNAEVQAQSNFPIKPAIWTPTGNSSIDTSTIQADAFILIDEDRGVILAQKKPHQRRAMAAWRLNAAYWKDVK